MASKLFSPIKIRNVEFRNRLFVSPMCQYSCLKGDGVPTDWHLVHLGSRATGGAGLVMSEASGVSLEGRISELDLGIWSDTQMEAFKHITAFIESQGAVPGIQIAHAGRKASTAAPWLGGGPILPEDGGWRPVAPSPIKFDEGHAIPEELSSEGIDAIFNKFFEAAERALKAGFKVIEIHMAHGYLLHEFLSPLSNRRTDQYGGSFENRIRLPLKIANAIREFWPQDLPVFVRISATDWVEDGWDPQQSIAFVKELKKVGIDLLDISSGGMVPYAKIPAAPGFQTPFSSAIKHETGITTGAVGLILSPLQAEHILVVGDADVIFIGRDELRDPYWPLHAAHALHAEIKWPPQYERAKI